MTNKEAIQELKESGFVYGPERYMEAYSMAIKALEEGSDKKEQALKLMEHIKDRPCEACEFKVDGNCTKWTCVFDAWLYSFVYGKVSE